jgi:hypothetical protein|tara:strand:- start:660 stop:779 length:120 start_codon:yes stop_codon:yes gene_type:complete
LANQRNVKEVGAFLEKEILKARKMNDPSAQDPKTGEKAV